MTILLFIMSMFVASMVEIRWEPRFDIVQEGQERLIVIWYNSGRAPNQYRRYKIIYRRIAK